MLNHELIAAYIRQLKMDIDYMASNLKPQDLKDAIEAMQQLLKLFRKEFI